MKIRSTNHLYKIVSLFQARVLIQLRPSVLDPAGEATKAAAQKLGIQGISKLRIGKYIQLEVEAPDEAEAKKRLETLSEKLLSNPVIEDWTLDILHQNSL